jgi:hypothetical protein
VARESKTTDHLREQSKHLLYEIQMLYALLGYVETREVDRAVAKLDQNGLPVRNAVIESHQLHARQLIEFLIDSPTPQKPAAGSFIRGKWKTPPERLDLQRLAAEFSERVMHLGWQRSEFTDPERTVLTHGIEAGIRPVLVRFLDQADPEKLCEGFVEAARAAIPGATPKPENYLDVQELGESRAVTTKSPGSNTGGTAIITFREPPEP